MQYLSIALPLAALVSGSFANPFKGGACEANGCLAAVTGKAALGDGGLRGFHCSSFLATTVTPEAITVTETITGDGKAGLWPRASVTVCPNEVPNYASACDEAAYTSACSCFGFTEVKTTTIAPTTTTKTVFVKPTEGCSTGTETETVTATTVVVSGTTCPAAGTVTKTGTVTVVSGTTCAAASTTTKTVGGATGTTVTVTKTGGWATGTTVTVTSTKLVGGSATASTVTVSTCSTTSAVASKCVVDDAKATQLVNNFKDLLEHTNYPGGDGYDLDVSAATLNSDTFNDISDSINFMAGYSLGSITFNSKGAFDRGQGDYQPQVAVTTLNIWHTCDTITWRWKLLPFPQALPVTGINQMLVGPDGLIFRNYAEFDSGAWLQNYGQNCSINPIAQPVQPVLKARGANLNAIAH